MKTNARLTRLRFLFAMLFHNICTQSGLLYPSMQRTSLPQSILLPSIPSIRASSQYSPFVCRIRLHSSFHSNNPTQRLDRRHNLLAFLLTYALLEHFGRALDEFLAVH